MRVSWAGVYHVGSTVTVPSQTIPHTSLNSLDRAPNHVARESPQSQHPVDPGRGSQQYLVKTIRECTDHLGIDEGSARLKVC